MLCAICTGASCCLLAGGSLLPCKRRSSAAVLPQTTHPATALACLPAGSLLKSAECSWQDMRYRSKLKQQPCSMAHGRWKQREQEGTLHPSAAPGLSHTLHRRLRARRTSRTTDCSLFQASTVICTAAAAQVRSARRSAFPPAHTCLAQRRLDTLRHAPVGSTRHTRGGRRQHHAPCCW